ncbi:flagellar motor switch protein FliG [Sphingorhabdus sp.]|uniref:flagellar motor switch protein FliG n=1 Tax=Sphingorhabdus sp. TaxID=1902408 RepID=UPI00391C85D5
MDEDLDEIAEATPEAPLDGGLSAAILLMLLEDADSSAVLQHLDPAEVKSLAKGMFEASCATENDVENALEVFVSNNRDLSNLAVGAPVRIREMMNLALGDSTASRIWTQIAPAQAQVTAPSLEALQWLDTATVSSLVANEHPQLAAIILSALPAEVAADAVAGLEEQVQADLLFRTATLGSVPAAAIADIEAILANYAASSSDNPLVNLGGHGDVAKIVNNLARPQAEKLLKSIRKKDKRLADAIEEGMFIFADLAQLDTKSLGAVMRNVEADRLALAIKGADAALGEKILGTLSARAAQTISDEIAEMGPVSRADVEEAQKAVIAVARGMAASGEIMLGKQSNDYV